jgi:hypothetical protein
MAVWCLLCRLSLPALGAAAGSGEVLGTSAASKVAARTETFQDGTAVTAPASSISRLPGRHARPDHHRGLPPIRCAALAAQGKNPRVSLVARPNETVPELLFTSSSLHAAVHVGVQIAFTIAGIRTQPFNGRCPHAYRWRSQERAMSSTASSNAAAALGPANGRACYSDLAWFQGLARKRPWLPPRTCNALR